jgi:tetratricopeptide (TPR) repeat protein
MAWRRRYCPVSTAWQVVTLIGPLFSGLLGLILVTALSAQAAPGTQALIAEVGAALDAGDAAQARRLAITGLAEDGVKPLERGRLILSRGLAEELLGAHQDAMADFTAAIETHALPPEERAQALLQRGFLLDGLNRLDDAAKDYSAVIELRTPAMTTALNNRANIYRRQNRLQEARRDYQAALGAGARRPQYPYYGLGQIAEAQHDKDAARGFYAKAVAADPGYQLAANRLMELGGPSEAALAQPDVIKLHPPEQKSVALDPAEPKPVAQRSPPGEPIVLHPPRRPAAPRRASLRPALDGPSAGTGPEVQLGAWRSEPEAQAGWDKAKGKARALSGHVAHIVRADIPGRGVYFRLRVVTPDPAQLCASLRSAGLDCVRVRN